MPVSSEEYGKVALATLIPGAGMLAAGAVLFLDNRAKQYWDQLKKPDWAPRDIRVYSVMDTLTTLPLGCASYLVYKHGGGFENSDTKVALGTYGASLLAGLASLPLMYKKDTKLLLAATIGIHGLAAMSAYLFYKIHPTAGYMMIPYALWSGFYVILMAQIHCLESDKK